MMCDRLIRAGRSACPVARWLRAHWTALALLLTLLGHGTILGHAASRESTFQLATDTFAYENELEWEYQYDPGTGATSQRSRVPAPEYSLHCVVMARAARQFFYHARFAPDEPKATLASYRFWVRTLMSRDSRDPSSRARRVLIPGFANLREFSREYEGLLKAETGGAWRSFLQRGNWRMVFPFSRQHQERTAAELLEQLQLDRPPLLHVVCFPALTLNHTILIYRAELTDDGIGFEAYDPNDREQSVKLRYDRKQRRFFYPPVAYFAGGPVNAYPIYRNLCY